MMHKRKTLNIPADLLQQAVRLSGATTETMAVVLGLEELVRKKKLEKLASFGGKGLVALGRADLKRLRSR